MMKGANFLSTLLQPDLNSTGYGVHIDLAPLVEKFTLGGPQRDHRESRWKPGFYKKMGSGIEKDLNLSFVSGRREGNLCFAENNPELQDDFKQVFSPEDLLNYLYALLHSRGYRQKYRKYVEFDLPSLPPPEHAGIFWGLVRFGKELQEIHWTELGLQSADIISYGVNGDNFVVQHAPWFRPGPGDCGKVFINEKQCFERVVKGVWEFQIASNRPAQKWVHDHRQQNLTAREIQQYKKILIRLTKTGQVVEKIDKLSKTFPNLKEGKPDLN